ncbi:MAG: DUF3800 domain-containing protein [Nitrospira sp.]
MKLFLDESGYTGEDLVNMDQPWFVLGSTNVTEEEAQALWRDIFKSVQAQELKHNRLRKTRNGQQRVAEFIKALKQYPKQVGTSVALKKYVLVTMLVDWWVEPYLHEDGLDLYEKGANIGMCNLMYITLSTIWGELFFTSVLTNFQNMMRERTPQSYNAFWRVINLHYNSASHKAVHDVLLWLIHGEKRLGYNHLCNLPKKVLDVSLTTAAATINHWRGECTGPLEIIHDESSAMAKDKWLWDQLTRSTIESATVGYDRRLWQFPLGVASTEFGRSGDYLQLQFADVVAGSTAEWCNSKHSEISSPYTDLLTEAGIADLIFGGMWPSAQVTPQELGTEGVKRGNVMDFISSRIKIPDEIRSR